MANLGYVGLGAMGGNMVDLLLAKGHTVTGYNRTAGKADWLVKKGMALASSPKSGETRSCSGEVRTEPSPL